MPRNILFLSRLPPELCVQLLDQISLLEGPGKVTFKPHVKLLIALNFFRHDPFQRSAGTHFLHPCSQSSVCRVLTEVIAAINSLAPRYITFPKSERRRRAVSEK